MKRLASYLIVLPVAIVALVFAVANRHFVTVSLDPFGERAPGLSFDAPLFIVLFLVLMLGVVVGGCASWLRQGRSRKAARLARAEAERYRAEADRLRAELAGIRPAPQAALPAPVPF
jgi:uncharacterized integral membrane protein